MRTTSSKNPAPVQERTPEDEKPEPNTSFSSQAGYQPAPTSRSIPAAPHGRLASLDAFRGLTIALMILVNNPGDPGAAYPLLSHAEWNGWSFADTVFPSFLFIVGVSLVFSFAKKEEKPASNAAIAFRILRRTIILFALGIFVNIFPTFYLSAIRIPGVLQRIALCYLFTSLIVLKAGLRGRILWLIALLSSYWLMMRFIPTPGIGTGVFEPGKNFAAWVDSLFLSGHMWSYYDQTWDPEGIVSTIPAIATTLFGVLTGQWLKSSQPESRKVAGMICAGVILVAVGQVLSHWLPINKSIWTSTFSIFMAGLALVCLALFHWTIDVVNFSRWTKPLVILGLNPITVYVLSGVLDSLLRIINLSLSKGQWMSCQLYMFSLCSLIAKPETASLLYAFAILLSMYLLAWYMWRKRIFIKV